MQVRGGLNCRLMTAGCQPLWHASCTVLRGVVASASCCCEPVGAERRNLGVLARYTLGGLPIGEKNPSCGGRRRKWSHTGRWPMDPYGSQSITRRIGEIPKLARFAPIPSAAGSAAVSRRKGSLLCGDALYRRFLHVPRSHSESGPCEHQYHGPADTVSCSRHNGHVTSGESKAAELIDCQSSTSPRTSSSTQTVHAR